MPEDRSDAIFLDELRCANSYHKTSRAALFLPVKSAGVAADARRSEYVVALRAVETIDFVAAHWARPTISWKRCRCASSTRSAASRGSSTI